MGAYGNRWARTPHIDALAKRGVKFGNAYCNYPLCAPSRASFWTGRLPHETGVISNGRALPRDPVPASMAALGGALADAGYHAIHFGKEHDGGALDGFERTEYPQKEIESPSWAPYNRDTFLDAGMIELAEAYLADPAAGGAGDRPFACVIDIQNPHGICGWIGAHAGPDAIDNWPADVPLPPLPENFGTEWHDRPPPVQYMCCAHRRMHQAARWPAEKYRHYLAAYHHYVSLGDAMVGRALAALEKSGRLDNTLIIFFADHGEGMAAHRRVTKHTAFGDETMRVPLFIAGVGVTSRGPANNHPLVDLLDLVPTICDAAGATCPDGLLGRSLLPWTVGETGRRRTYLPGEWHTEWGFTIEPGRMIRTDEFKYTHYLEGGKGDGEELYDLHADPGEMRNLVGHRKYADSLREHRELLEQHCEETNDPYFDLKIKVDPRWRSHPPGTEHHTGPCAPDVG